MLLLKWVSPPLPTCNFLSLVLLVIVLPPIWLKRVAYFLCVSIGNLNFMLPWSSLRLIPWVWQYMIVYPLLSCPSARFSFSVVPLGLGGLVFSLYSWWWSLVLLVFSISSSNFTLRSLYSEALFTGCSCTVRMFTISCCCAVNASLGCRITLVDSSLSPTKQVVWCLILTASLIKKSLMLLQLLALLWLSRCVSHNRLNNIVSLMSSYAERRIFLGEWIFSSFGE